MEPGDCETGAEAAQPTSPAALRAWDGYVAVAPDGELGLVELPARPEEATDPELLVRGGATGRLVFHVPSSDVTAVSARLGVVHLRSTFGAYRARYAVGGEVHLGLALPARPAARGTAPSTR
jgi:hypothetical protein